MEFTLQERILIACVMLQDIQSDIHHKRYSIPGRVNIQSVLHLLTEPKEILQAYENDEVFKHYSKRAGFPRMIG